MITSSENQEQLRPLEQAGAFFVVISSAPQPSVDRIPDDKSAMLLP